MCFIDLMVNNFYFFYFLCSSFSPTDNKFASCSDDGLVKIWDFYRCAEERVLRGNSLLKHISTSTFVLVSDMSFDTGRMLNVSTLLLAERTQCTIYFLLSWLS